MVKLFIPDWILILCNIENGINILILSKKSGVTYKTCLEYVKLLHDKKFITITKVRNSQIIKLTEKGKKYQDVCFIIEHL